MTKKMKNTHPSLNWFVGCLMIICFLLPSTLMAQRQYANVPVSLDLEEIKAFLREHFETYTDREYGFSMMIPKHWKNTRQHDLLTWYLSNYTVNFVPGPSAGRVCPCSESDRLNVGFFYSSKNDFTYDSVDLIRSTIDSFESKGMLLSKTSETAIGQGKGTLLTFVGEIGGRMIVSTVAIINSDKMAVVISGIGTPETTDVIESYVKIAGASFKVL
jgi:hypothetical protein